MYAVPKLSRLCVWEIELHSSGCLSTRPLTMGSVNESTTLEGFLAVLMVFWILPGLKNILNFCLQSHLVNQFAWPQLLHSFRKLVIGLAELLYSFRLFIWLCHVLLESFSISVVMLTNNGRCLPVVNLQTCGDCRCFFMYTWACSFCWTRVAL